MRATPLHTISSFILVVLLFLVGCGGDVELDVTQSDKRKRVTGTVELPNGELAAGSGDLWQRFAAAIIGRAQALTGNAFPVGAGIRVELVQLSREAAAAGRICLWIALTTRLLWPTWRTRT
jgi:hypothetical protein